MAGCRIVGTRAGGNVLRLHIVMLYDHASLVAAATKYPDFASTGTTEERRREVAALLANLAHETTGGWPTAPGGPEAWGLYFTQEVAAAAEAVGARRRHWSLGAEHRR